MGQPQVVSTGPQPRCTALASRRRAVGTVPRSHTTPACGLQQGPPSIPGPHFLPHHGVLVGLKSPTGLKSLVKWGRKKRIWPQGCIVRELSQPQNSVQVGGFSSTPPTVSTCESTA